jgi:hypothetical protein
MVFNATFKNISVISWQSVLFVDENGVPGENHRPVTDGEWRRLPFRSSTNEIYNYIQEKNKAWVT